VWFDLELRVAEITATRFFARANGVASGFVKWSGRDAKKAGMANKAKRVFALFAIPAFLLPIEFYYET